MQSALFISAYKLLRGNVSINDFTKQETSIYS